MTYNWDRVHSRTKSNGGREDSEIKYRSKFEEFCKRTDLHGFKYIVMEELTRMERFCWALAVALSMVCAGFFVVTAYRWYARNPIGTVIESTQGAIWDVPFPAVTICDLNKVSRKAAQELANNLTLPPDITPEFIFKTLRLTPKLHSYGIVEEQVKRDLLKLQEVLDSNRIHIQELFERLAPARTCGDILHRCMWKNSMYRCEQLFQQIYMAFNICCIFNYYAVNETDLSKIAELIFMPTPRRVSSCGYHTALTVLLKVRPEDYYSTDIASKGAVVFIDNAYNFPDLDSPFRFINPATEVLIGLSPESTYTTEGIKYFSPINRQCYYHDEIKIARFLQYSYHNCMAYRKVQIIEKACNCVPFYFPQEKKDTAHICNFRDMNCLEEVLMPLHTDPKTVLSDDFVQCLPECEHYDYPLEIALGYLASGFSMNALPFYADVNLENHSILNVFFNDLVATRYRRDVYLNWQNILAAFGGLLSLMLGFTLISGFDFILFIGFRVIYESVKSKSPEISKKAEQNKTPYKGNVIQVRNKNERNNTAKDTDGYSTYYGTPIKY